VEQQDNKPPKVGAKLEKESAGKKGPAAESTASKLLEAKRRAQRK
jgi:hypothetical protein